MINVYEPHLTQDNLAYAKDALDSSWISSHGKYINLVKDELLTLQESSKYVILCNNGTSATHLMAIGLRYKYPTITNVIVPNNVYVAAWNAFQMNPYYNLIPIDADVTTWNYNLVELDSLIQKTNPNETAILIVHNIGSPVDVPALKLKYPDYVFLEDNCEGFLGRYGHSTYPSRGVPTGSVSFISSVSFFGNKNITSGEGGAIFLNDSDTFEYLNSVRSQGITQRKFVFDKLGYNYRMTNVQAAILYGQLKDLHHILDRKRTIFDQYYNELVGYLNCPYAVRGHSMWMFGCNGSFDANLVMTDMFMNGIETRPMFPPISFHEHLKHFSNVDQENVATYLHKTSVILPSHVNLTKHDVTFITNKLKYAISKHY